MAGLKVNHQKISGLFCRLELTRGAELPGEEEVAANPRAASVRLRAVERIDANKRTQVRALHQPTARRGGVRSGRGPEPGGGGAPTGEQRDDIAGGPPPATRGDEQE